MARLARRFGWTWVGAVVTNNDYGLLAMQAFREETQGTGICLVFVRTLRREKLARDAVAAAETVATSSARVILIFTLGVDVEVFLTELLRRNVTERQFIASEAWSTSASLLNNPGLAGIAQGTLGVAIRSAHIPGFEQHLQQLHPSRYPTDFFLRFFWRKVFGCSPDPEPSPAGLPACRGTESLARVQSALTDVSALRATYNVYVGVYAVAHALHSLLECATPESSSPEGAPSCFKSPDLISGNQVRV